jgi:hypothetical protein
MMVEQMYFCSPQPGLDLLVLRTNHSQTASHQEESERKQQVTLDIHYGRMLLMPH